MLQVVFRVALCPQPHEKPPNKKFFAFYVVKVFVFHQKSANFVDFCFFGAWIIAIGVLFATKKLTISSVRKMLKLDKKEDMGDLEFDEEVLLDEDGQYIILEEEIYVEEDVIVDIDNVDK